MVGDYLLQTDWQARHKRGGLGGDPVARRALFTHVTTYTLAFLPAFIWIGSRARRRRGPFSRPCSSSCPHLMIDDGRLVPLYLARVKRVRRAQPGARRLGRPVLSRALAVPRGAPGGRGMSERRPPRGSCCCWSWPLVAAGVGVLFSRHGRAEQLERSSVDARFDVRGDQRRADGHRDRRRRRQDARHRPRGPLPLNRARAREGDRAADQGRRGGHRLRRPVHRVRATTPDADDAADRGGRAPRRGSCSAPRDVNAGRHDDDLRRRRGAEVQRRDAAGYTQLRRTTRTAAIREMPFRERDLASFARRGRAHCTGTASCPRRRATGVDRLPGPAGHVPAISFADVERGRFDPAAVRGKIVVVGATAPRGVDVLADLDERQRRDVAARRSRPRRSTRRCDGFPLHAAPGWLTSLLAVVLAVVAPLVALRFGTRSAARVGAGRGARAFLVAAQLAFNDGTIIAVVPPLAGAFVGPRPARCSSPPPQRSARVDRFLDRITAKTGNQRTRRLRALLLLGAAFVVVTRRRSSPTRAHVLRTRGPLDRRQRFRVRGMQPPRRDVVVAAIDDKTFDSCRREFPIPRDIYARVDPQPDQGRCVGHRDDVQFTEPSRQEGRQRAGRGRARRAQRRPLDHRRRRRPARPRSSASARASPTAAGVPGDRRSSSRTTTAACAGCGSSQQGLTSFAIAAARRPGRPSRSRRRRAATPGSTIAGPPDAIQYAQLHRRRERTASTRPRSAARSSSSARPQTSLQDQHNTSTTRNVLMPGPEIQANAIATALEGFPLHRVPWWVNVLLIVAVGVAAPLAGLRLGCARSRGDRRRGGRRLPRRRAVRLPARDAIVTVVYPLRRASLASWPPPPSTA